MLQKVLLIILFAFITIYSNGCKKRPAETETKGPNTLAEYQQQAKQEINSENMLSELEKIEKEMAEEEKPQE